MSLLKISAVIITRDDAQRVAKLAKRLSDLVDDVVVLIDDRSEKEVDLALSGIPNCQTRRFTFIGFGAAKREVVSMAKNDWVFSIDADEMPDQEAIDSLKALALERPSVYKLKRLNHYCDRPIKACGWYPDYVIRVFHRKVAGFTNDVVHESVKPFESETKVEELAGHILHYSFNGSHELLQKLINYSTLYADNYQGKPKPVVMILLRSLFAFVKFYIFKKGLFYGRDGFIISLMNAGGVFHKHWRAGEIQRNKS